MRPELVSEGKLDDSLLEGLFGDGVRVAWARIEDRVDALLPEELVGIREASHARQAEFATGRWLARRLLGELGHRLVAIPRGPDRAPLWPVGCVGSITHSASACAVAVASASRFRGIGLDLEHREERLDGVCGRLAVDDDLGAAGAAVAIRGVLPEDRR